MDIQSLKLELVKRILEQESTELLSKIQSVLNREERDFWLDLTENQKKEIEIARNQISNGEMEDWETVKKRLSNRA